MNACFDAKLLHIACKTIAYNCVNLFVLLHFKLYGSRAETTRGRICCFAGHGCRFCSTPRGFGPQTAYAGRTELADGVSNMGGLLELLLRRSVGLLPPLQHHCSCCLLLILVAVVVAIAMDYVVVRPIGFTTEDASLARLILEGPNGTALTYDVSWPLSCKVFFFTSRVFERIGRDYSVSQNIFIGCLLGWVWRG
jgi:hypothetical protein